MPSIPCVLKAKLSHHKEGRFLINLSFSLLTCCCKPTSFCYVKGIHLPCIHLGPLSPLTTTKEKHFTALAVNPRICSLLLAPAELWLDRACCSGSGTQGTVTRALSSLCATAAIVCCCLWSTGRMESTQSWGFSQLSLVWSVLCSSLGETDIALLCSGAESFPLGCAGNNSVIIKQS